MNLESYSIEGLSPSCMSTMPLFSVDSGAVATGLFDSDFDEILRFRCVRILFIANYSRVLNIRLCKSVRLFLTLENEGDA
jgi:hypothetical protein